MSVLAWQLVSGWQGSATNMQGSLSHDSVKPTWPAMSSGPALSASWV